mgnify:CR=1 FL=1
MTREPWRLRCPECGSTQVTKRTNYGDTPVRGEMEPDSKFYCRGCNQSIEKRLDAKTQTEVA